jgi:hypothetical protein
MVGRALLGPEVEAAVTSSLRRRWAKIADLLEGSTHDATLVADIRSVWSLKEP